MKKEQKRQKAFISICIRVIALTLCLWLALTGLVTWAVAADIRKQAETELDWYLEVLVNLNGTVPLTQQEMMDRLEFPPELWIHFDTLFPFVLPQAPVNQAYDPNEVDFGFQAAAAYYDKDLNLLTFPTSVLYFDYVTEEMWNNADVSNPCGTIVWDVDTVFPPGTVDQYLDSNDFFTSIFLEALRISGYWDNSHFVPVTVERMYEGLKPLLMSTKEYWELDQRMDLPWEMIFDRSGSVDRPLEVIYGINTGGSKFERSTTASSVTVGETTYPSLLTMLLERVPNKDHVRQLDISNTVISRGRGFALNGSKHYAMAAIQCDPLGYAVGHLWHMYLITFAALAVVVYLMLRRIHTSLIDPLTSARFGILKDHRAVWQESYAIGKELLETKQALTESENRVQQLTTALEYAKNAEENRRQLVSNLAHELKTPLAVTHSYAEGLQEGIAPEKEDHYLSVILQETERMDGLVLQMLDLSRLEAGKVHLAADRFDLLDLAKDIFTKLQPALDEKELTLFYPVAEPAEITADLERITQVVQNLATNAIKYTPAGGKIYVRVFRKKTTVLFSIENTCPPLSKEALQKVWESFYRGDNSRSSEGTGLGLAIVRGIVSLHRGTCSVQNTSEGVQFSVTLPQ